MTFRSAVFVGGLGDMVITMYESDSYTRFDTLLPGDSGAVAFFSVNPFVTELFDHHPKRNQINVVLRRLCFPVSHEIIRSAGVDPADGWKPRKGAVVFHPSPEDVRALSSISGRYLIFALAAGHPGRNVPVEIAQRAVAMALAAGYKAVLLGRTYDVRADICWYDRKEVLLEHQEGMVNLIDRLTVPGSLVSLEGAAGVVCTHSAICLGSWYIQKPTYTLYPAGCVRQWEAPGHKRFWPGINQENSWNSCFDAWNPDNFRLFLESLK